MRIRPEGDIPIGEIAGLGERQRRMLQNFSEVEIAAGTAVLDKLRPVLSEQLWDPALTLIVSELHTATLAIDKLYMATSFYADGRPVPGDPSGEVVHGGGMGFLRRHADGAIYWRRDLGAHWVRGDVYARYIALGAEGGFLGYPISEEIDTTVAGGQLTHFEHASIYWHQVTGAHEIHGAIRQKWQAAGGEQFGFPTTDETATDDGAGRYNHFCDVSHGSTIANASIVCSPGGETHSMVGAVRSGWLATGGSSGYLGYPITDLSGWVDPDNTSHLLSHFQRGAVVWTEDIGEVVSYPERIVITSPLVTDAAVTGWIEIVLASSGYFHYRGHMHNSGAISLAMVVDTIIKIPGTRTGIRLPRIEKNVGGTVSLDSRDEDWSDQGSSPEITANWEALRTGASATISVESYLGSAEFFVLVFLPVLGVVSLIVLIFGGDGAGGQCDMTEWEIQHNGYVTTREPGGVRCGLDPDGP
jgi:hypothetical protein